MKVGIITVHHYRNFGSALQAYASQKVFEKLGYNAYIIDYRSPCLYYSVDKFMDYDSKDDSFYKSLERKKKGCLIKRLIYKLLSMRLISHFLYSEFGFTKGINLFSYWMDHLKLTRRYDSLKDLYRDPPCFDVYVVGGDQLWNTYITYNNPAYYLSFAPSGSKRISYSTSIGIPFIPEKALGTFQKGINNLSRLLLREEEGVAYLRSLGYKAERVLDPTLMLDKREWAELCNEKYSVPFERYILAYFLNPSDWTDRLLETVHKQTRLPIIIIGKGTNRTDVFYTGSIEVSTFLTLFSRSEIVVTNSFHGMAFTIIFEKILIATYRGSESSVSMNSRQRNLINMLDISSSLQVEDSFIPDTITYSMDYQKINELLQEERERSLALLNDALNN